MVGKTVQRKVETMVDKMAVMMARATVLTTAAAKVPQMVA